MRILEGIEGYVKLAILLFYTRNTQVAALCIKWPFARVTYWHMILATYSLPVSLHLELFRVYLSDTYLMKSANKVNQAIEKEQCESNCH